MQQELLQPAAALAAAPDRPIERDIPGKRPYVVSVFLECCDALLAAQKQIHATDHL